MGGHKHLLYLIIYFHIHSNNIRNANFKPLPSATLSKKIIKICKFMYSNWNKAKYGVTLLCLIPPYQIFYAFLCFPLRPLKSMTLQRILAIRNLATDFLIWLTKVWHLILSPRHSSNTNARYNFIFQMCLSMYLKHILSGYLRSKHNIRKRSVHFNHGLSNDIVRINWLN